MSQKIKLIAFDLDNTLAHLGPAHFESLNQALATINPKYVITNEEQVSRFEGLSTKSKLKILIAEKNFPADRAEEVFQLKQQLTTQAIEDTLSPDPELTSTISRLKQEGYILYIASNAIKDTIVAAVNKLGIAGFFDYILSNEDVVNPKPHPQIYLKAMVHAGVSPEETLIVEDSKTGRQSAQASKAHLCEVNSVADTNYEHIKSAIALAERSNKPAKWYARNTCNILILASGSGSRMRSRYHLPKPLIDVAGKPMIQRVVENLNIDAKFTFVVQAEHCATYNLESYLNLIAPDCNIVKVSEITQGAACSALLAKEFIDNDKQLLIANSDQYVSWDSSSFMYSMISKNTDGQVLTFKDEEMNPKWSFAKLNDKGYVSEVAEKKPISDLATVGIYAFARGKDFVKAAEKMIEKDIRVNNEFYLCPVYNEMIADSAKISTFNCEKMQGLGTIEDLDYALENINFDD